VPARVAETRAKPNSSNPTWNEVMSIEAPDGDIKDGAVLRLDVMQFPVANEGAGGTKWPSLGGVSLPLVDIEAGHQYDLCVEIDPGSGNNTSRLGLSVSGRASTDSEAATLKVNSQVSRTASVVFVVSQRRVCCHSCCRCFCVVPCPNMC
jgi:hypothetical protein